MKAVVFTQYGSPDVLQLKEVEKPLPNHQVLVKVHAASVNALDRHGLHRSIVMGNGFSNPKINDWALISRDGLMRSAAL